MGIKDLKVYGAATPEVKKQFAHGDLREHDMVQYTKSFSCLPLEKSSRNPKVFLGFEWETAIKGGMYMSSRDREDNLKESFIEGVLKKALSTPVANYLNLRDEAGEYLELVSIPATLGYHKRTLLKQFFANKLNHKFTKDPGCGFHVHVDNQALDENSVRNVIWFLSNPDNNSFITIIAGRNIQQSRWCNPYPVKPKYRNGKLVGIGFIPREKAGWFSTLRKGADSKSICFNTSTDFSTCELRIFTSPQTYPAICKNLEFTEALVKYCKGVKLHEVSVQGFKDFVKEHKGRYNYLDKFLKKKCK